MLGCGENVNKLKSGRNLNACLKEALNRDRPGARVARHLSVQPPKNLDTCLNYSPLGNALGASCAGGAMVIGYVTKPLGIQQRLKNQAVRKRFHASDRKP